MGYMVRSVVFVMVLLALPATARANRFDCEAVSGVGSSGPEAERLAAYAYGTVDTLGNILCFVGDPRCDCLRSITPVAGSNEQTEFSKLWKGIVASCASGSSRRRSFSGIAQEAALELCVVGEKCGPSVCAEGEICCNESCGICTPPDGACIDLACCNDCSCALCGNDEYCDDISGTPECLPLPTCDAILCEIGTHCELVDVACIREPCPPQPACVAD